MSKNVKAAVSKILTGADVFAKADKAIDRATAKLLPDLVAHLKGAERMNAAQFDASFGDLLKGRFAKLYPAKGDNKRSDSVKLYRYRMATLAIINGKLPEAGETLQPFVSRMADELKAAGIYAPKTGGGRPKGSTGGATKVAASAGKTGKAAADKATEDALLARIFGASSVQTVRWLATDKVAMSVVVEMYGSFLKNAKAKMAA